MNRIFTVLIAAAALPLSAHAAKYTPGPVTGGGGLTGRIYFTGAVPPTKAKAVSRDGEVCGASQPDERFVVSKDKSLANVVVWIEGITAGKPFEKATPRIVQKACRYEPHVTAMPKGKVEIVNQDAILHNIHAEFDPEGKKKTLFNLAQPFKDQASKKKLRKPGIVGLKCDVHNWMSGYVVVRDNPYYAVTGADGTYHITDIPPGTYTVVIWQEEIGSAKKQVTIEAGKDATLDLPIGE